MEQTMSALLSRLLSLVLYDSQKSSGRPRRRRGVVTDGTSVWVENGTRLKVFKYTLPGSLLGSWVIDPVDNHLSGITINPNNVSDLWIVDNGTRKVYLSRYRLTEGRNVPPRFASRHYSQKIQIFLTDSHFSSGGPYRKPGSAPKRADRGGPKKSTIVAKARPLP
jgi:hypothetical protein